MLILANVICYVPAFDAPFIDDDILTVVESKSIRSLNLGTFWGAATAEGRPVLNLTYALNYALHGLNPTGFRIGNLLIHLVNVCLLYVILFKTLELRNTPYTRELSFAIALGWSIHQMNIEAVSQIAQRAENLMGFFYLLTMLFFIQGRMMATVITCALGMATKEAMVTAPLVILLYDWCFLRSVRKYWITHVALFATWIVLIPLVSSRDGTAGFHCGMTVWEYFRLQPWLVTSYARHWLTNSAPIYTKVWTEIPQIVFPGELLIAGVITAVIAVTGIVLICRRNALGFLIAWYYIILSPSSSVIPICSEIGAEHRMYLSSIALAVLVVGALCLFVQKLENSHTVKFWLVTILIVAAIGYEADKTFRRNAAYGKGLFISDLNADDKLQILSRQRHVPDLRTPRFPLGA